LQLIALDNRIEKERRYWEQYYAARIEAWFKPDSGGPERKLAERILKIEGRMR